MAVESMLPATAIVSLMARSSWRSVISVMSPACTTTSARSSAARSEAGKRFSEASCVSDSAMIVVLMASGLPGHCHEDTTTIDRTHTG